MSGKNTSNPVRRQVYLLLLLLTLAGLSFVALIAPQLTLLTSRSFQEGQVAQQEILAPVDITYESHVLTEQQRDAAARAVPLIYSLPDTSIARQQLEKMRTAMAFITSVRSDSHGTQEQKINDLAALEDIELNRETVEFILALNDARWLVVQQEAIVSLEQVMRSTIREDRLEEARRNVPALVSLSLPERQAAIAAELAAAFVAPNSFYSQDLTDAARANARDLIAPVTRSYKAGENILQRGQVIRATDLEALQELGLAQPQEIWKNLASAAMLVLLVLIVLIFYRRRNPGLFIDTRSLTVITILFLVFLGSGRLLTSDQSAMMYIFPLAAYSMTIASLFGQNLALVTTFLLSILVAYGVPDALILVMYYSLGGFLGVFVVGRAQRVTSFFWAGILVAGGGAILITAYNLPDANTSMFEIAALSGAALLNGIASASLALLLQFLLAQLLGMTTALQLMEISRPDHTLLQLLLRNAPGTYQHSLQVANLAEQAAERIGADPLLTRVGALYHDVGKALNPLFFIENQAPGISNPHETLEPVESAQIIIQHITNGVDLARKYRVPSRIQDFILEHHGDMLTRYQYVNAVKAAGGDENEVDEELFRYPGPPPQSRETAILMLADGSEARVRAERPENSEKIREVIKSVIQNRISTGQLDHTGLTMRDMETITDSFATTLQGMYHPRIEYPTLDKSPEAIIDPNPTVPIASRGQQEQVTRPQHDVPTTTAGNPK